MQDNKHTTTPTTDPADLEQMRRIHEQLLEEQPPEPEQPLEGQLSFFPTPDPADQEHTEPRTAPLTEKEAAGLRAADLLSSYTTSATSYRKNGNDPPPSQQKSPETKADQVRRGVWHTTAVVEMLRDPIGTLYRYHFPADRIERAERAKFEEQVKRAVEITGGDPEQIRDPDRRTPEQHEAFLRAEEEETIRRIWRFLSSSYYQVYDSLPDPTEAEPQGNLSPEDWADTIKKLSTAYFFATHPDTKPTEIPPAVQPEQLAEAAEILRRMDRFTAEQQHLSRSNGDESAPHISTIFSMFISAENPEPERAAEIMHIVSAPAEGLHWPLDILSSTIFKGGEIPESRKVKGELDTTRHDSKTGKISSKKKGTQLQETSRAVIKYALSFGENENGITISKQLTPYDKRVMQAASEFFCTGNPIFTVSALYRQMGYTTKPNSNDMKKIIESIEKQAITRIAVDNNAEASLYNYPSARYSDNLMMVRSVAVMVRGKIAEAAFELLADPILMQFAKDRQQVTYIPRAVLESPLSKTDENLAIEDYILCRISRMKRGKPGKTARRILFSTIFEQAGIKDKQRRRRAKARIIDLMEHYVNTDFIYAYEDDQDGITIDLIDL